MKTLKRILLALLILIAIPLIAALFVPKEFTAGSEITVNKPKQEVFDYIKYVKNQDNFGVWQLSDPGMKKSYEGTDGTPGFRYSWEGEKTGKGTQTILSVREGERVETELDFGFGDPAKSYFTVDEVAPGQTKVTWGISGKTDYPFNVMSLFYDMNKDFEKGLQNLKGVLEK